MGRSIDWLDVLNTHGPEAVAHALRQATPVNPHHPHQPPHPHHDQHAGGEPVPENTADTGDPTAYTPPPELVLPAQAGARARVVLERLFAPEKPGGAWRLRRFAGAWYVYVCGRYGLTRWREWDDETLRAAVRELLEGFWTRRWVERKGEWTYQRFAPTDRVVDDILKALVHRVAVASEDVPAWLPADFDDGGVEVVDRARWLRDYESDGPIDPAKVIAFRNGLLDAEAWIAGETRLLPHTERWFSMSTLDTDLPLGAIAECGDDEELLGVRAAGMCPAFINLITEQFEGDESKIDALQRFVGYLLTGDTSLDKALWVQGAPGTGKTTLVEGISAAIGTDNVAETTLDALARPFGVAPLVGKLAAVIPEMHVGHLTNVAAALERFKSISGGSPQQVERKFMHAQTRVRMSVRFILTPNQEPRLPDASAAIVRRLVVLRVNHVPARPDPTLSQRLADERAGVRLWGLIGLRRLWREQRAGRAAFPQPEDGRELLDEIEARSSPIRHFVRECCVTGPGNAVATDTLWEIHKRFREAEGYAEMTNRQTFGSDLRAAVPGLRKRERRIGGERMYVYEGVRPIMEEDEGGDMPPRAIVMHSLSYDDGQVLLHVADPRTPS